MHPSLRVLTTSCVPVGHAFIGVLWFNIFLQLFLILGVLHTLATDSIAMHRLQISVFGAVAIVFAVEGVNNTIFSNQSALDATAAGWLILAFVDILWVLYFTSEEDSLILYWFNSLGTGGLTPPGRRRRRTQSMHNMGGNGYNTGYAAPGTMGPAGYDAKPASFAGPMGSGASFKANSVEARSITGQSQHNGSIRGPASVVGPGDTSAIGLASPAMSSGAAGVGAGGGQGPIQNVPSQGPPAPSPVDGNGSMSGELYRAKAMYPCKSHCPRGCFLASVLTTGSPQTKQMQTTRMKYRSRRARCSKFWTSRANGGRPKKQMGRWEVSVSPVTAASVDMSLIHYRAPVAPSNYLQLT